VLLREITPLRDSAYGHAGQNKGKNCAHSQHSSQNRHDLQNGAHVHDALQSGGDVGAKKQATYMVVVVILTEVGTRLGGTMTVQYM
jgi:hypothetical protein